MELFDGTVSSFGLFDQVASERFTARPDDARRLMSAVEDFDVKIAQLFGNLPAIAKCLKHGKAMDPVVGQTIAALGPVERELAYWATRPSGIQSVYSAEENAAIDACVQDLRDDMRAINIALQHFVRRGTLSGAIALPESRAKAHCTVL